MGDQPHYLLVLNSIINDHDFDLNNNYYNVYLGTIEAGALHQKSILDHHTVFVGKENKEIIFWEEIFKLEKGGMALTPAWQDKEFLPQNYLERSYRAVGLPLLIAPLSAILQLLFSQEFAILLISKSILLLGFYFLYKIGLYFSNRKKDSFALVLAFAFASPLWFYSKTFFTEPYLAAILIIVYYLSINNSRYLLQGLLLGMGVLIKNQFILVPFFVGLLEIYQKKFKNFLQFFSPVIFFAILQAGMNYYFYGSFFPVQKFLWGNPFAALFGLFFNYQLGLFFKMPYFVFAFLGFVYFLKYKKEFLSWLALLTSFLLPVIFWRLWDGGWGFAPRLIVPIIPLFYVPIILWYDRTKNKWLKIVFWFFVFSSLIINFFASFFNFDFLYLLSFLKLLIF